MLCPIRKNEDRSAKEPNEFELNSIRNDPEKVATIFGRRHCMKVRTDSLDLAL